MGSNYADYNLHDKAIECYEKALDLNPKYVTCLMNISASFGYKLNFIKAIEYIDNAIQYAPVDRKEFLKIRKKEYEEMGKDIINLKSVSSDKIKSFLYTGEHLVNNLKEDKVTLDFSPILMQYAKGLETMLHDEIMTDFRNEIMKKYSGQIPQKYVKPLPSHFKRFFLYNKTISLGNWAYLLTNIDNKSTPLIDELKDTIKLKFSQQDIVSIRECCKFINSCRVGPVHDEIKDKKAVLNVRKSIISHLNKIINLLY